MRNSQNPFGLLVAAALFMSCGLAARSETTSELAALKSRLAELEEQVAQLAREIGQRERELSPAATTTVPATPATLAVVSAGPGGFSIGNADRTFQLCFRANMQVDARFFLGGSPGSETFVIRRLRPIFEGSVGRLALFKIMPDLAPSTPTVCDAYADLVFSPELQLRAGKFKAPVDLERLVSQSELLFIERAHPTSVAPDRDLGLQLQGSVDGGRLAYAVGLFNGVPDGGRSTTDTDDHKDVAARVFLHPFQNDKESMFRGLGFGIAGTWGERSSSAPAGYKTLAQQSFFSFRSGVTGDGVHWRISPQGYFFRGPFGLMATWALSSQELALGSARATVENTAWQIATSWVLTGEDAGYRGLTPKWEFNPGERTWGALELAFRLSGLRVDDDAFPVFANPAASARSIGGGTLGLNWYLNRNVKAVANYEFATFEGGAPGGSDRPDEHAILTRLQLRY